MQLGTSRPVPGKPAASPEQRVGAALRAARRAAAISLREMAKRLHYGSHSVLSEYENGARMPSETVVQGYERLLALQPGTLTAILEAANIERHGDAWPKRRIHVRAHFAPVSHPNEYPRLPLTGQAKPLTRTAHTTAPESAFARQPIADGSDPDAAGCSQEAITVHSRRIALRSNNVVIGHVELRYNEQAGAVWGRFEGYASLNHVADRYPNTQIMIEVERQTDGARQVTCEPYCFDLMWGNLLTADPGTFVTRAAVLVDSEIVASGETDVCRLG